MHSRRIANRMRARSPLPRRCLLPATGADDILRRRCQPPAAPVVPVRAERAFKVFNHLALFVIFLFILNLCVFKFSVYATPQFLSGNGVKIKNNFKLSNTCLNVFIKLN